MQEKLTWLHISDIHFSNKTEWRDETNRTALLEYLGEIFSSNSLRPDFIFCTGDIAFGATSKESLAEQYSTAREFFDALLRVCGSAESPLAKERLFVVPGNHDVNRKKVNADAQHTLTQWAGSSAEHISNIEDRFATSSKELQSAMERLSDYGDFVKEYLPHQCDDKGHHLYAHQIEIGGRKVGIAGFNSAWSCYGEEDDRNLWLAAQYQFNLAKKALSKADIRIGLIHHPVDWLNQTDREITNKRIASDFDFWLHGHSHDAWVSPFNSHITVAAGAVGARMSDEFGVNVSQINFEHNEVIVNLYRTTSASLGWTIAPIARHAPLGEWIISAPDRIAQTTKKNNREVPEKSPAAKGDNLISRFFSKRLDDALKSFNSQKNSWIERIISRESELAKDASPTSKVLVDEIVRNPRSSLIKAPPQYGLSCLAHHLIQRAWAQGDLWLYLDARELKPNRASVDEAIHRELDLLGCDEAIVKAVVLDSWNSEEKQMSKLLNTVSGRYSHLPLICMQQVSASGFSADKIEVENRNFEILYLWSMSRNHVRNMVASYNEVRLIGDEDSVTTRLVNDLQALNLHRTPLNCLTLLKVSEFDFDENPVNRSEIIKRVLFLLFNVDSIPTYKTRPDVKDCEYVLGHFCETLIRNATYSFSRDHFLKTIQDFCKTNLIDLETHVVFDVLFTNNILVRIGNFFSFKFSYWIFYFAAQRMYQDQDFANFILTDRRYAQFPEVIEFYTGIDRRREDALIKITGDLTSCIHELKEKLKLPDQLNPYRFAKWEPSAETHEQMEKEITESVLGSNLPSLIKDEFADRNYDPSRPYNQKIGELLEEFSFTHLLRTMSAASRALRNSDYVSPNVKRELLTQILHCWDQAAKVLFIVLPILAKDTYAAYDGITFVLGSGFGDTPKERFLQVLSCIPQNIMTWTKDDLYSRKMGPLLIDQLSSEQIGVVEKHILLLLLLEKRPRDWEKHIQRYIAACEKNSFYLMDIYVVMRAQYRYGFASSNTLRELERLLRVVATKHKTGEKIPGEKSIKKMKFPSNFIPLREPSADPSSPGSEDMQLD